VTGRRAILIGASPSAKAGELARAVRHLVLGSRDLLVGVDGGVRAWKRLGHTPHLAVGDWDSLGKISSPRGLVELTLPQRKDRSDLYWACRAAVTAGATELVCLGVTGGRPDHSLATLLELSTVAARARGLTAVSAFDSEAEYCFLSPRTLPWRRRLPKGRSVSVFATQGGARGVTLSGVEYPLKGASFPPSSLGLSNRASGGVTQIRVTHGSLVVILPGYDRVSQYE
jgi:thiamine pyrophosphokinase